MENKEEVSVLNDLLHIINDRQEGFSRVEAKVWESYPAVKTDYARMHSLGTIMKNELMNLIQDHGGDPSDTTTVAGALHRTWIDIRNSFTIGLNNIQDATIENVVFGEKAAIEAYQNAIDSGKLSQKSLDVVSEHLKNIKDSYYQFKQMIDYKEEGDRAKGDPDNREKDYTN